MKKILAVAASLFFVIVAANSQEEKKEPPSQPSDAGINSQKDFLKRNPEIATVNWQSGKQKTIILKLKSGNEERYDLTNAFEQNNFAGKYGAAPMQPPPPPKPKGEKVKFTPPKIVKDEEVKFIPPKIVKNEEIKVNKSETETIIVDEKVSVQKVDGKTIKETPVVSVRGKMADEFYARNPTVAGISRQENIITIKKKDGTIEKYDMTKEEEDKTFTEKYGVSPIPPPPPPPKKVTVYKKVS